MYEIINEGSARIYVPREKKISKKLPVFYNPIMKFNRDVTILLLKQFPKLRLCDPLAATGVRAIRFIKELDYESLSVNDYSKGFIKTIKRNLILNKVPLKNVSIINNPSYSSKKINKNFQNILVKNNLKINRKIKYNKKQIKIIVNNEDANEFLLKSEGFDYIDIDPYGSPNPFLDSAVKRISRNGIVAVTATDLAPLCGTIPKACIRKYWAMPKHDWNMHETGLRILIRKIQLIGAQFDKALRPIFSYYGGHYFRVFFNCVKGKKKVDEILRKHKMFNDAGPLWTGGLWDKELVKRMLKSNNIKYNEKFLKIIFEESKIESVGFYNIHAIVKKFKIKTTPRKDEIIRKIRRKGYKVSETHFADNSIRSNIKLKELISLIKR